MVVRQICKQVLFMRHLKKSITDKVTLFYCYFDSEHPRYTWVVVLLLTRKEKNIQILVPTMHVGCSLILIMQPCGVVGFSTHDARGLQCRRFWILKPASSFSTHDARGLQYKAAKKENATLGGFSTHDARGLQQRNLHKSSFFILLFYHNVLHLSSAFSNKFQIFHPFFLFYLFFFRFSGANPPFSSLKQM